MPQEDSVLDQLTKDFPAQDESPDFPGEIPASTKDEDELPENMKNRHIRRVEAKLAKEREDNIRLATELKTRSEYENFTARTKDMEVDESLLTLYGNDENGRKAAQITQNLLDKTAQRARDEALQEFRNVQEATEKEVEVYGDYIDNQLETIEDSYNVDLSGGTEQSRRVRNSFLDFVAKVSPKDASGAIIEYADIPSAWEIFQDRVERANTRQREVGSRSMARSGSQVTPQAKDLAGENWLKQQGII